MFKLGDRVKCIRNNGYESSHKLNQEYEISFVAAASPSNPEGELQLVKTVGQEVGLLYASRFVLIDAVKTPSKDQILKASESSPQAKEALKVLFPDLFPKQLVLGDLKPGDFYSSLSFPKSSYMVVGKKSSFINLDWAKTNGYQGDKFVLNISKDGDVHFDLSSLKVTKEVGFK